jgi:cytochrome c biogenesis protein CcdA
VQSGKSYLLLVLGVAAVAVAGYAGYAFYPRFDLPSASGIGLLVLAAAAGVASFFSPCSFPLLVTLVAREVGEGSRRSRLRRALGFGAALSVGASAFLLLCGAAIALGAGGLFTQVTFTSTAGRVLRLAAGGVLIVLGAIQSGLLPLSFHGVSRRAKDLLRVQAEVRRRLPALGLAIFGFGYLLAGFG